MNNILSKGFIFTSFLACSLPSVADSEFATELRAECAHVHRHAQAGKKLYDQKQYQKAIAQFQQQAAWSEFCEANRAESGISFSDTAISTAFNNVGLSYLKSGKPQWARAWFSVFPEAKSSQFNLKQLPPPQPSRNLTGNYVQYAGFGQWNSIEVQLMQNLYQIRFNGLYMGLRSLIYGPNLGEFTTTMPRHQSHTRYRDEDCTIELSFAFDGKNGQQLILKQDSGESGCGFGHNVFAEGSYLKVES